MPIVNVAVRVVEVPFEELPVDTFNNDIEGGTTLVESHGCVGGTWRWHASGVE